LSILTPKTKARYHLSFYLTNSCAFILTAIIAWGIIGCESGSVQPISHSSGRRYFEEIAQTSGIQFEYRNGEEAGHYAILETLGGGVGLIDYDGDGWLDVFLIGGGQFTGTDRKTLVGLPGKLYRNLGPWRFQDVTEEVQMPTPRFYSHGVAIADFDRDGWPDILVTGYDGIALYHNIASSTGGRRFVDVSKDVGLPEKPGWCTSAAWGDFNLDGFPDLYICRYVDWSFAKDPPCPGENGQPRDVCTPKYFDAIPDLLLINESGSSGRRFRDMSAEAGLRVPPREDKDYGKGLGVIVADLNDDGWPDIYVANDTTDNLLYLNQKQQPEPRFVESGLKMGVARDGGGTPNGSMGVDIADYDGSGRPALWVTNYESELHALYRNVVRDHRQFWQFSSQSAGTAAIGQLFVGFGTVFLDFDGDGWEDLFISHGHVLRHSARGDLAQRPVLLKNEGGRFREVSQDAGEYFQRRHRGRGVAVGDLDNDGRPDLVVTHVNSPVAILRNTAPGPQAWLGLYLPQSATWSRVEVEIGGRKLVRFIKSGGSYLSSSDPRILIGLPSSESAVSVTAVASSGKTESRTIQKESLNNYLKFGWPR
jgi:hypothetical protein